MRTAMSPGCHTPRNVTTGTDPKRWVGHIHMYIQWFKVCFVLRVHADSGTSSLSNAQIADHYANCIKLSSENVSFPTSMLWYARELYQYLV